MVYNTEETTTYEGNLKFKNIKKFLDKFAFKEK